MPRETFFPTARRPSGFSPATRAGKMVFVSGHTGVDASGKVVGPGDIRAQSEQTFKNVLAALKAAGATKDDVTKITCFLVNADDYAGYAAERLKIWPENGPASSTVIVKALVSPQYLVEIEAVAVLK